MSVEAGLTGQTDSTMIAKFQMSLWLRIKAATKLWWAIVVTGEIECTDKDEPIAP